MRIQQIVRNEVHCRKWLNYINPVMGVNYHIERKLVDECLPLLGENYDWMDCMQMFAQQAEAVLPRWMSVPGDYKLLELHLSGLFKRTVHLFMDVDAGKRFICDRPILPYKTP